MRCALLCIPGLIADRPDSAACPAAASPALHRLLARSLRSATACETPEALLCDLFDVRAQPDLPAGALTLLGDGGDPGRDGWLRADPVHLRPDQGALLLSSAQHLQIAPDEALALTAALSRHFEPDGLRFEPLHPARWYVRMPTPLRLRTHAPSAVEGRSVDPLLPAGPDAMLLHRWFNEAQMLLHTHPVNEAREARGAPAVNSVWFWGAGPVPDASPTAFEAAWGDDALLRGLCLRAGVAIAPAPAAAAAWLARAGSGRHLILPQPDADRLEQTWFAPLLGALRRRQLESVILVSLHDGMAWRFALHARDLWKFWRRGAPFAGAAHA